MWRIDLGWNINHGIWFSPMVVRDLDGDSKAEVCLRTAPYAATREQMLDPGQPVRPRRPRIPRRLRRRDRQGDRQGRLDRARAGHRLGGSIGQPLEPAHARRRLSRRQDAQRAGRPRHLRADEGRRVDAPQPQARERSGAGPTSARRSSITDRGSTASRSATSTATAPTRSSTARSRSTTTAGRCGAPASATAIAFTSRTSIPTRPGLEVWYTIEDPHPQNGVSLWDALTGTLIFGTKEPTKDNQVASGLAGDIDPAYPGMEVWGDKFFFTAKGETIPGPVPPQNELVWWDADPLRETHSQGHDREVEGRDARRHAGLGSARRRHPRRLARGDRHRSSRANCGSTARRSPPPIGASA